MSKIPFIDLHQDIASNILILSHKDFFKKNTIADGYNNVGLPVNNQVDFPRLKKANAKLVFAAACPFEVKNGDAKISSNPILDTLKQLKIYSDLIKKEDDLVLVKNWENYQSLKNNKLGFILHIEGSDFIDQDLQELKAVYQLGVRSIGLTHNQRNHLATGASETKGGLSNLGQETIIKAQELGMIIDLAHLNQESFNQAIEIVKPPFMFSHGGLKEDFDNPRNLNKRQIKKIAQKDGIIGICFVPNFLSDNKVRVVAKIYSYLKKIVGVNNLAVGSDFDGIISKKLVQGLEDVSKIQNLQKALVKEKFKLAEIEKIFYKNAEEKLLRRLI